MANNIYLGNLPEWVTADDVKAWIESSDLVCDSVRVIRDFETQQSKGYAFVEAPNKEEMDSIIRRFHRAPIEGRLLQAKAAHPAEGSARNRVNRRRRRRTPKEGARTPAGEQSAGQGEASGGRPPNAKPESVGTLGEALQKAL